MINGNEVPSLSLSRLKDVNRNQKTPEHMHDFSHLVVGESFGGKVLGKEMPDVSNDPAIFEEF
jgi:hypothetical protein